MLSKTINPIHRAFRRYTLVFFASMAAYAIMLCLSRYLLEGSLHDAPKPWQILLAVSPALPILYIFFAVVRLVRTSDEMMRQIFVNSLALAGGITALLAATYGLIGEGDNVPYLSAFWSYGTFMAAWLIIGFIFKRRYR